MYPECFQATEHLKKKKCKCTQCKKRSNFEQLLRTASAKTHFTFNNKLDIQHNGVGMGAPLAPIIAEVFMANLETTLMNQLNDVGVCE
ncbi:unnamed protein product [Rotaria sp. Silwood1]|nr:unnamed protein product [Rotaria sp. Silwood1]